MESMPLHAHYYEAHFCPLNQTVVVTGIAVRRTKEIESIYDNARYSTHFHGRSIPVEYGGHTKDDVELVVVI